MGWDRFDRRRNNKESVVAAYLSDEGSAPMPRLQVHTRLEEGLLFIMRVWSRQSSRDTRDEVLKKIKSTGQISTLARFKNGAESYGIGPKCRFHFWDRFDASFLNLRIVLRGKPGPLFARYAS
jgi:hypothetical protein